MSLSAEDQAYLEKLPAAGVFDPAVPHPARRYNYWLDGKDNFEADRRSADEIERLVPGMRAGVRANRDVLQRVVRHLTEAGVRQSSTSAPGCPRRTTPATPPSTGSRNASSAATTRYPAPPT
jgi:hypothetical protein